MLFDRREPQTPSENRKSGESALWLHWCVAEKTNLFTARGEPCNWCGAREGR